MRGVPDDVEGAGMAGRERGAGMRGEELAGCSGDGDDDGKGGVGKSVFCLPLFTCPPLVVSSHDGLSPLWASITGVRL